MQPEHSKSEVLRLQQKLEKKWDDQMQDRGEKELGRSLIKMEKIFIDIRIFKKESLFDLTKPEERKAFENTNVYAFHFMTNMLPLAGNNTSFDTPSKRDRELAEELGYTFETSFSTFVDHKLLPKDLSPETLHDLLEDACFKYGFTLEGILEEQRKNTHARV